MGGEYQQAEGNIEEFELIVLHPELVAGSVIYLKMLKQVQHDRE